MLVAKTTSLDFSGPSTQEVGQSAGWLVASDLIVVLKPSEAVVL